MQAVILCPDIFRPTRCRGAPESSTSVSAESADAPALRAAAEKIAADEAFEQELNAEYRRLERARQQIARHVEITQAYLQRIQREVARVPSGST